jgi:transposase
MRQRALLITYAANHIQPMQKALALMNIQLSKVVDAITGVTGLKIIRAMVAGERIPEKLAEFRDGRCKQGKEVIAKSVYGNYREEPIFLLQQALALYDFYQAKMRECDDAVNALLDAHVPCNDSSCDAGRKQRKRKRKKSELQVDVTNHLQQLVGVDLTKIDGLGTHSALRIISEIGTAMRKWPTPKHFGSWLGLAPGTKISGGKLLGSKTKPSANRAAAMLRIAASTLHRSHSALGAFLRRLKARVGAPKAMTATAYKIARISYLMIQSGKDYVDVGQDYYDRQYKARIIKNRQKRAKALGFELTPIQNLAEVP